MKLSKRNIALIIIALAITGGVIFQNCGGTLTRTANLNVDMATVKAQLSALQPSATETNFFDILNAEGSSLYYAETGSSMGGLDTVMPLDWKVLGITPPQKAMAYFIYVRDASGPRGALMLTGVTAAAATTNADGTTAAATSTETILFVLSTGDGVGTFTDDTLILPATDRGGTRVTMTTQDTVDGDLADVIQIELLDSESNSLGFINFAEPE